MPSTMVMRAQLGCSAASAPARRALPRVAVPIRATLGRPVSTPFGQRLPFLANRADQQAPRPVKRANAAEDPGDSLLVDADAAELKKSAGLLRGLTFVSFWTQLALCLVSGVILLFSVAVTNQGANTPFAKWAGFGGVVLGLFSTFFAHGFNRLAKKLQRDEKVSRGWIVNSLVTNNTLNLLGIGSAILGLQASVGDLVAKSLLTSQGFGYPPAPGSTVASLDIYALQALGNILLCHFVSLCFTNLLLRVLNKPTLQAA